MKQAEVAFGHIDYALCCAGAAFPGTLLESGFIQCARMQPPKRFFFTASCPSAGRFLDQDVHLFVKTTQIDYFGSLHIAKAVLPSMVQRKCGHILFTSSPLSSIGRILMIFPVESPAAL